MRSSKLKNNKERNHAFLCRMNAFNCELTIVNSALSAINISNLQRKRRVGIYNTDRRSFPDIYRFDH